MTTKHLWFASVLAACTANAASPEPSTRGHACAPELAEDAQPHDVLRIASADGSGDIVLHAWTDDDGEVLDVHAVWQPSFVADEATAFEPVGLDAVPVGVDAWRVTLVHGGARHDLRVERGEDTDVVAHASVITGDEEPTWCRLRSARLFAPRLGRLSLAPARVEARCEDASGTEVEGWIARAPD